MKIAKNTKGFTLIELLIVISIIGILAVAFLPSLLGAPAKARDTQRVADLQKIQKVLINYDLENGSGYPNTTGAIVAGLVTGLTDPADTWGDIVNEFGGSLPAGPSGDSYYYIQPSGYSFGLVADGIENIESANSDCPAAIDDTFTTLATPTDAPANGWCYVVFAK